jgi:hypothetical protein
LKINTIFSGIFQVSVGGLAFAFLKANLGQGRIGQQAQYGGFVGLIRRFAGIWLQNGGFCGGFEPLVRFRSGLACFPRGRTAVVAARAVIKPTLQQNARDLGQLESLGFFLRFVEKVSKFSMLTAISNAASETRLTG